MLAAVHERTKEFAGGAVVDVDLHADIFEVRLKNQFVIQTPRLTRRGSVFEFELLAIFCTIAISTLHPTILIEQFIRTSRIKLWTGSICLIARNECLAMIGT